MIATAVVRQAKHDGIDRIGGRHGLADGWGSNISALLKAFEIACSDLIVTI